MSFIVGLFLVIVFGWLTHRLFKKGKRGWAFFAAILTVGSLAGAVDPDTYADSEPKTEETASHEKTDDAKEKEAKEKEEAAKKAEAEKKAKEEARKKAEAEKKAKAEAEKKEKEKKEKQQAEAQKEKAKVSQLPSYNGQPYVEINGNVPYFSQSDLNTKSFEKYSPLDSLGRCGVAYANIGRDTMPTGKRQAIGSVKPSGWHTVRYSNVDGKYLYNRCHLIGYQLTAENANECNLITGTRYLNVEGMLPFENMVADYIKSTNNHVLYRVTPYFEGDNLVASGVQMEAKSVEDNGKGILFNVYCFNNQPGVSINYANGDSELTDPNAEILGTTSHRTQSSTQQSAQQTYSSPTSNAGVASSNGEVRGNRRSKIYHMPGQRDYENMGDSPDLVVFTSPSEAEANGYRQAKR